MAKKAVVAPVSKNTFSFLELAKKLNKVNPESELLTTDSKSIKIENWIGTGNYMLNALISGSIYKGIPEGRITILAGEESTGKTFLALNICREALKQGFKIIWIDTENAMDDLTFLRFGIDVNEGNVIRVPIDIVEHVTTYLANLADSLTEAITEGKEIGKYLVVLDSLGQLSTQKEVTDAKSGSEKADMTRAKEIKRLFRVCTKRFGQLKIPMIVTNHIYASIGFIPQSIQGGGSGGKYSASSTIFLSKAQLKEEGASGPKTGALITAKIDKSRFTRAGMPVKFHISFYKGMNPFVGLEEFISWDSCGIAYGKLEKGEFKPGAQKTLLAVKHLGKHVSGKQLWTPTVFTKEILDLLEPKIKEKFELPPVNQVDYDLMELLNDGANDIIDEDTGEVLDAEDNEM